MSIFSVTIDDKGTIERMRREMAAMPAQVEKARKRALRKLSTWAKRQVLRAVSSAAGVTQKRLGVLLRYHVTSQGDGGISIWIGTNPIKAHYLGTARWTRRMKGARVGRRLFEHAWSWGGESKTWDAVMRRTGAERLPIETVTVEINDVVAARVESLLPEISKRFESLMIQELNYALRVAAR